MFARIALLLGVLCIPVLLALASQGLAENTDPPQMPAPSTTAVASLPSAVGSTTTGTPQMVQIEPQPVGSPADLDGDRDDDGVPDERDDRDTAEPATAPSVAEVDR